MMRGRGTAGARPVGGAPAVLAFAWALAASGALAGETPAPPASAGAPAGAGTNERSPATTTDADADGFFDRILRGEHARLVALAGRPEAVVPLAAIASLVDDLPPAAVEGAVRAVADDRASDPLVAAQATLLLAERLDARGEASEAERRRGALGLLRRPWVVGPFGDGRDSFAQAFAPEVEGGVVDPARRYAGKEREVSWRAGGAAVRQGALLLDGLLRPNTQTAAYVAWAVSADRARAAVVRIGSPGPFKLWVNGQLVVARDVVRAVALDQDAAAVRLRRGDNRILMKTVVSDGAWRLLVRLTDDAGRPVAGIDEKEAARIATPAAHAGPAVARVVAAAPRTLEALLRARAAAAPAGAAGMAAWLDLGRFLAWNTPADRDARADAAALEQAVRRAEAPKTGGARSQPPPELLRLSLETWSALADVARDDDERRRALERAAAVGAGLEDDGGRAAYALVLAKLGDVARQQRHDTVAIERWRQALRADAGCWPAQVALAEDEQSAGLTQAATARLEALPAGLRAVRRVGMALVRQWQTGDRHDLADPLLAELARARQDDAEIAHQLSLRARQRGEAAAAVAALRRAAAWRPELSGLTVDLARALEGNGDREQALASLRALAARLPDDAPAQAQLGKLLLRMGKREEARQHLALAVALKPQDATLRRFAARAAQDAGAPADEPGEDLARRYAADPLTVVPPSWQWAATEKGTTNQSGTLGGFPSPPAMESDRAKPDLLPRDPALVLLDRRVVRVHSNGLADTFAQRVVAVATDHGAEENKEFLVRYQPGAEEVEIRQARIYRRAPGGEVQILEAADRDDRDLSEPWYGLYYDERAQVVRFEGLRAGDVLDVEYAVVDTSNENEMSEYFGDLQFLAEPIPKLRWDYTLIGPKDRVFYTNTPRAPTLEQSRADEGADQVLRFAAHDLPKIDVEPAMPGYAEVSPYLHVSTYARWSDVGAWYWRLVAEQLAADETLRQAARGAVTPAMSEREKVRAIHGLVLTGTRYVGLEFGIHGFKPYKVTQVLSRRFGDCKDKAALMVAFLRAVGVDAEMVLLRTRRAGRIDPQPASLAVFDHAIVYVPKLDIYLDGTAEFSGMDELPSQDQGVMGLRVSARGTALVETPVAPSARNRARRRWTIDLEPSGQARVDEVLTIAGQAAADWREHYQTPGERLDRYGKVWTARNPGAALQKLEMPGIEDRGRPVEVHAVAVVPHFGVAEADHALSLPITARDGDFVRAYARLSARTQDLVIAYPWQHDEELIFRFAPAMKIEHLPSARTVTSAFGRFRLDVEQDGPGRVRVRSALDVTHHRLGAAEYPRFREFLGAVDAALADHLLVRADPS
ncbi:MAG TPA: DUF3857 and transglutaminase domain-containing protein [Polyangia bacterium]|nr:DUF3857 and transglutaminase domain-containing protein [Polyangia bacterium]